MTVKWNGLIKPGGSSAHDLSIKSAAKGTIFSLYDVLDVKTSIMKKYIVILISFCLGGCGAGTEITGSWRNSEAQSVAEDIHTIMVTALTPRANARQRVENDLATALQERGYQTIKSIDVLPPTFTDGQVPDKTKLLSRIEETGADAILTVALIDENTESRYVPGSYGYAPYPRFGYYGTFWGYYTTWYPTLYSPGYYEEDKVYFIETNLYDAESEQLLWSAQSETYNPRSLPRFASDFAKVVVTRMVKEDLLDANGGTELARERE